MVILLFLTFVAGGADATTFLFVGGAFVSNQTGTVLLLAIEAGGAQVVDITSAAVSIVAFVVGASLGEAASSIGASREVAGRNGVGVVAGGCRHGDLHRTELAHQCTTRVDVGLLAFAMGQQAALASRMAIPYLTTGFMTGFIVKSGMESPVGDRSRRWWWYAATPVATIAVGALLVGVVGANSVPGALAVLAVVVTAAAVISQSRERVRSAG